jgi:hypothetical protein
MRFLAQQASGLILTVAVIGYTADQLTAQACPSGPVALDARATLLLPATFGISGVAASPSGLLTLWSAGGQVFSIDQKQTLTSLQLPDSIRPAGMTATAEGLRILDQQNGREYLRRADGSIALLGQARHGMAEQFDQAIWRKEGWIIGLRDMAARSFVVRRYYHTDQADLFRSAPSDSLKTIHRYQLSDSKRGVLLTRTMSPFTVIRLDPASGIADTLQSVTAGSSIEIPADSLKHWRALSTVALDCTLLLTLSDLTADRRILVRYGADDRVERATELDAPLGLVTRLPGKDAVLAARRAGELELVWYDWHWVREPSSPTP